MAVQPLDNSACIRRVTRCQEDGFASASRYPSLVGNATLAATLNPQEFADTQCGLPTVRDIIAELGKPGRDPRSQFRAVQFDDNVQAMEDFKARMILEGQITNVTHFGAFVDIGVHQTRFIHISQLSNTFVKDPKRGCLGGDIVKVKVMEVDVARKRISVTHASFNRPRCIYYAPGSSFNSQLDSVPDETNRTLSSNACRFRLGSITLPI